MVEVRAGERGAALLTVLLLVAVMAVIAAAALERLTLATRLTANAAAADQARAYAEAAEAIALLRIGDLVAVQPGRTTLQGGWHGAPQAVPVPSGTAVVRATDGGNCFNLNSLVTGQNESSLSVRPLAVSQFQALMQLIGIDQRLAQPIATATADWIDSDSVPLPGGAEDETYVGMEMPYRTANRFMADPSELRAVVGVTPAIYTALRPWICALPASDLSPVNVNTLLPQQAPLYAMMLPNQMTIAQARELLARRPTDGYGSVPDFWRQALQLGFTAQGEVGEQVKLKTRWFRAEIMIELGDMELTESVLIDAEGQPRIVRRQWGEGA